MTILYKVYNNLYVNLTNRCPCACTFCLRQTRDHMDDSGTLWLKKEPTVEEVIDEFKKYDLSQYKEIVFCGFGEPTEALDVLLPVAKYLKAHYPNPIRINTNGLGNLIYDRDITPEFEGLIDTISISLNTPDAKEYHKIVCSKFGEKAFDSMLDFAEKCTKHIPNVVMTTVATTITPQEEEQCQKICSDLNVTYRIRPFED
ncbi:TIGR04100 family radical SAM protein [Faecalitalea cylindroides]|uniref:TIGR04100 family radical SAM protein n=1 Tax=Faecalitalea cylindroides TaxID=39483 RepID=UPI0022E633C3|nr:TIGR04100 family radical SAM protein [Faecalitalea cylindroides]